VIAEGFTVVVAVIRLLLSRLEKHTTSG